MSRNNILVSLISVVVTVGLLWLVYLASNQPAPQEKPVAELQSIKVDDHVKWGGKEAKNILFEFSDLQCPACKSFHELLKPYEAAGSAEHKVAQNIAFVYRHFPLTQPHKNAMIASIAAEAAGRQGKFFQMSDLMFENQSTWENEKDPNKIFTDFAKQLKLDLVKYEKDLSAAESKNKINADVASGTRAGVNATPMFYLNGRKMNYTTVDDFKKQLDGAVTRVQ